MDVGNDIIENNLLFENLVEVPTAIALVSMDHRIIFRSREFFKILPPHIGHGLPPEIDEPLKRKTSQYIPTDGPVSTLMGRSLVSLPQGLYRMTVSFLRQDVELGDSFLLLYLAPALEPHSKMNFWMEKGSLTKREMEIASLIRDGLADQEIGRCLYISIHTVKNHIKSMHQKLNVHNRGQLVAALNH